MTEGLEKAKRPEKPDPSRRRFFENTLAAVTAGIGAGVITGMATNRGVDKIVEKRGDEADTDPVYRSFLESVNKGDFEVMRVAIEQVKSYDAELTTQTERIEHLENELISHDTKIKVLIERSIESYKARIAFLQSEIRKLSDPVEQYLREHPSTGPMPIPDVNKEANRNNIAI